MGIYSQAIQMDSRKELQPEPVIHPLDDVPEEKVRSEGLGPIYLTSGARWSLLTLRGYLIAMGLLVLYRCIEMAGDLDVLN